MIKFNLNLFVYSTHLGEQNQYLEVIILKRVRPVLTTVANAQLNNLAVNVELLKKELVKTGEFKAMTHFYFLSMFS